jgi:hypothetical protein
MRRQFTPRALQLFASVLALECECPPRDWSDWPGNIPNNRDHAHWERWYRRCAGCEEWARLHGHLHAELRCKPWEWPCIQSPTVKNPWPEGSAMWRQWKPDLEAQALWRELEAALAEVEAARPPG